MNATQVIIALLVGYGLGSIPFGLVLGKLVGTDVRAIGSGNIGATNVLRTGRKGLALATLLGDMFKGTAAVLLMRAYGDNDLGLIAGLAAVLGHVFPIWLKFKGGKGVATYIGVLIRRVVADRRRLWRDLGRGRRDHALLLALGPGRKRDDTRASLVLCRQSFGVAVWRADGAGLAYAPRQHRQAGCGHRTKNR